MSASRWRCRCVEGFGSTWKASTPRWRIGSARSSQPPDVADVALVRLGAPFEPRDDLFLESFFHQGTLEFPPGVIYRLAGLAQTVPVVVDVALDRAAVLTPIRELAGSLT